MKLQKANHSLKYYNGLRGATVDEGSTLLAELERLQSIPNEPIVEEKCTLKDICKPTRPTAVLPYLKIHFKLTHKFCIAHSIVNRKSLKPLLICMVLACLEQLTGIFVIVTYPVAIFKQVGASHIDPYMSSIIMATMKIVGTLCTSMLCDSLGRKWLFICSFFGCGFGLLSFALYSYLRQSGYDLSEFDYMPVAGLAIVVFGASAGVIPLYSICTVETLPTKVFLFISINLCIATLRTMYMCFFSFCRFELLDWQYAIHFWIYQHLLPWNFSQFWVYKSEFTHVCQYLE